MTTEPIILDEYLQALERLQPYVRRTPLVKARPWRIAPNADIRFKAECCQVTGSFKARGAFNRVLNLPESVRRQGLATASGGNFGAAVAYVGQRLALPADIFVMNTSTPLTRQRIESYGARLTVEGDFWDQSWDAANHHVAQTNGALMHPYADRDVIIGQGTTALEIIADWPEVDTLVVSIGGGGLIAGIAQAAKLLKPDIRIIGVEASGCPTLHTCRRLQRIVKLEDVTTIVPILAARSTEAINFDLIERYVDEIVLVPEEVVTQTAQQVWANTGLAIELGAATAVAAVTEGCFSIKPEENIAIVLCGSGTNGI